MVVESLGGRPKSNPVLGMGTGGSTGDRCTTGNGPAKQQRPAARERAAGRRDDIPAATYSPTRKPCSTIASSWLDFRVRNGNGWIDWRPLHHRKRTREKATPRPGIGRRGVSMIFRQRPT